jgi:carboxypeptidase C (cathepsin A)
MNRTFPLTAIFLFSLVVSVKGQAKHDNDSIPKPIAVQTHHSIKIGAQVISYTATVGSLILRDDEAKPTGVFGFTSYTKDGEPDLTKRPLTFAFNGGPGSSSLWLHLGVLGPRRVALEDDPQVKPAPPYQLIDNPYSILDVTDLVMIDPVGTGISRPAGKGKNEDFWGIDQDIRSVSNFIKAYIKKNDRWNSPKFLLGESYGTTRSAGIVDHLQENMGIAMNGVILVSTVLSFNTLVFSMDNDMAYISFLPTYAAVAYYHNQLPQKPAALTPFLDEVRSFASDAYKDALFLGAQLPADKRKEIISRLHQYTGLDEVYWDRANLRVSEPQFTQELMRKGGKTTGRLDARYAGINQDLLGEYADYDPQSSAISPPYTAMFLHYYYNELKAPEELDYRISAYAIKGFKWDWKREGQGGFPTGVTVAPDLQDALVKNPQLRVMVMNGYYDLATPFYGAELTFDHMNLPDPIRKNVIMKYYPAGHMMYIHKESLPQFKNDVSQFISGH